SELLLARTLRLRRGRPDATILERQPIRLVRRRRRGPPLHRADEEMTSEESASRNNRLKGGRVRHRDAKLSDQDLVDDFSCHISEAVTPPVMEVSQSLVIHAEEVKQSGVEIVDTHRVLHSLVANFVGLAMTRAAFNAGAGQPSHESIRIVVATTVA